MMKSDAWKNWEGRVVDGKFPLRQWLGSSEHSAVFLTEFQGQKASIKLMEVAAAEADRETSRLRSAAGLSHPHLIRILATGRCRFDGALFLYALMEYAEEELSQILPQRALTPAEVGDLLPPLLEALAYLHDKGLVHGHLKPSNILAVQDHLKLSTDQLSSAAEPNPSRRKMGMFDAPEAAAGILSPASDVWSLGVTIVDALTQHVPSDPQSSPGLPDSIPEPFRGIARECLHLDPKRRCSIAEIRARLEPPGRSVPAEPERAPTPQSSQLRTILIAAALIVVAVLVVWGLSRPNKKSSSELPPETSQPATPAVEPKPTPAEPASPTPKNVSSGAVRRQVLPDVSASARNTITGTIKISVRVDVDSSGRVTDAKLKSSGPSRYFAEKALNAAREWEFSPSEANGQPTSGAWVIQFRFRRSGIQAVPERLSR